MATLTETLDNLYTTTWMNMKSTVADNIFDGTPFWFWLRKMGGLESVEGGRFLEEPLRFAGSDNVEFVKKGTSVALNDKEFLRPAIEDWRYLADTIVRFGVDEQQNRGKNRILSLMQAKLDNSKDSLIDKMETALVAAGGTDEFVGLQDLIADDPTASVTLHGINGNTDDWWRNQFIDQSGSSFGGSDLGIRNMNKLMNSCSKARGMDGPDIIFTGQIPFEFYWNETLDQRRITNRTLGDKGFQNLEFRGIPVVWTPAIVSKMYFINTKFFKFKYDPSMFFDMTNWKEIPSQINDRAAQVILAGNLMTSRRRVHGVLFAITTV